MKIPPFDYAVRNLGRSTTRLALCLAGSGLVVTLVIAAAAFVRGMNQALTSTGEPDNVIILGAGSEESIERSEIDAGVASLVSASIAGIRTRAGVPYVSPEVQVQINLKTRIDQPTGAVVVVRGITPAALLVHASVQIVEGRPPMTAADEVMVGAMVATKIGVSESDIAVGNTLLIDRRPFKIVGRFLSPGTVLEPEVWMPLTDLKEVSKRTTDSCVVVTLDPDKAEFADVATFVKVRPDLELAATPETAYYGRLAAFFAPIRLVVWTTALLIGMGGLFGGLNTLFAAFASRVRELGMLQSIGYRRVAVLVSLVQESTLATTVGALLGCLAGVALLDGIAVRFSRGVFGLNVDAQVLLLGLGAGVALGALGALPPAIKCLRLEIPTALKAM